MPHQTSPCVVLAASARALSTRARRVATVGATYSALLGALLWPQLGSVQSQSSADDSRMVRIEYQVVLGADEIQRRFKNDMSPSTLGIAPAAEMRTLLAQAERRGQLETVARPAALLLRNGTAGTFSAELQLPRTVASGDSGSGREALVVDWRMTPQIQEKGAMVLLVEADSNASTQQRRTTTSKVLLDSGEMVVIGLGGNDPEHELLMLVEPQIVATPPG